MKKSFLLNSEEIISVKIIVPQGNTTDGFEFELFGTLLSGQNICDTFCTINYRYRNWERRGRLNRITIYLHHLDDPVQCTHTEHSSFINFEET